MKRRGWIIIFALVSIPFLLIAFNSLFSGMFVVTTLSIDGRRSIRIWTHGTWEIARPIYFEIQEDGKSVFGPSYFDSALENPKSLQYTLLESADHTCVAIVRKSEPETVRAMYNFVTKVNYPGGYVESSRRDIAADLETLQVQYPDRKLKLD